MLGDVIPIAGDFSLSTGGDLNPQWTPLKSSASNADRGKEGVRLEMHGGKFKGKKQKVIVEFLCKPGGNEEAIRRDEILDVYQEEKDRDEDEDGDRDMDDKIGEETEDEHGGKLKFHSWEDEGDVKVLRLDWDTKYACEDAKDSGKDSSSGHWGVFTWFIIM